MAVLKKAGRKKNLPAFNHLTGTNKDYSLL